MDVIFKHIKIKKIKLALIFFAFTALYGCKKSIQFEGLTVHRVSDKPISISFFSSSVMDDLTIHRDGSVNTPVLGELSSKAENIYMFTPVVPFSEGQSYSIHDGEEVIGHFKIAQTTTANQKPELLAIYPSANTIPENLLKLYLVFSEPMQEVGNALDFISITDNNQMPLDVFLSLESELWNAEHTRLTLWLDPGRIKTDLIPNKEKGLPLAKGETYTVTIDTTWRSAKGISLGRKFSKRYQVTSKDISKPEIENWELKTPNIGVNDELVIDFKESLDAILTKETIHIYDQHQNIIEGDYELSNFESVLTFVPKESWKPGDYTVKVHSKLEDLAGNNMNHLFDVDISSEVIDEKVSLKKHVDFTIK